MSSFTRTNMGTGSGTTTTTTTISPSSTIPSFKKPSPKSLTYIITDTQHNASHVLPIQSLRTSATGSHLYTAGRDGVVSVYDCSFHRRANIQLHSDWVNEVIPFTETSVVSCSSDLSVKCWDYERGEHQLIGNHSDYVKCVTGLAQAGLVLSGGLDREVKLWDVERCVNLRSFTNEISSELDNGVEGKGSIYSISSSKITGLTVYGDNDGGISVLDPLNGQLIKRFKGHQGAVVRSLHMKDNFLLSCGADGVVKLWDLRTSGELEKWDFNDSPNQTQRTSIWSCYSPEEVYDFSEFYCGDSRGRITKVDANKNTKTILPYVAPKGVLSLFSFQDQLLSSSMANSDITNHTNPEKSIDGEPGLIKSRLLNDRRHVVTLSTNNEVNLWDIVSFEKSPKKFPANMAFDDVVDSLQTQDILPSWCRVTIKAGQLFVTLNEASFANVEVYGDDLWGYTGLEKLEKDTRFNLGKLVLCSLLQGFVEDVVAWDAVLRHKRIKEITGENIANSSTKGKLSLLTKFGNDYSNSSSSNNSSAVTTPTDENSSYEDIDPMKQKKRSLSIFGSRRASKSPLSSSAPTTKSALLSSSVPNGHGNGNASSPLYNAKQPQQQTPPGSSSSTDPAETDNLRPMITALEAKYQSISSQHLLQASQLSPPSLLTGTPILSKPRPDLFLLINERTSSDSTTELVSYSEPLHAITKDALIDSLPAWIGNCILQDKVNLKETPKIGFVLIPEPNPSSTSTLTDLPPLRDDSRLSAYTMLRVSKILCFAVEKLDPKLVSEIQEMNKKSSTLKVEDWLELLCQGDVVPNNWTLAMVRTRMWKGSGDVKFTYRRKVRS
ncbi:hypothetical protein WICPIJ_008627 [Wickerhamomyces pijperi]|uniref:WD repeat-containing protein 48 n=1 Tax=Wickerhamomyces pijperi TaxID=599730 RepID=A0A9P8PXG8_WICPI|nr:hypothetical protein WICPIJ_008627 [Wickerhamomyces pijperi]